MLQAACLSVIKDPNVRTLICATCLSKDRVLHSLQVLPHRLSICNAVTGITLTMQDNICWECKAQLLRMLKFREKAVRSQCMLTSFSQLIQEHRSGQEGGIAESLSTLSQNEPLYYEVGINIPAQEQTTQVLVKPTEEMIDNTPPAIVTYDESEFAPRPLKLDPEFDHEGNGLETQPKVGVEGIALNTIDEEQKNTQDYLDIADVVSDRAAPDVLTALGFFKEEHIDLDDAEKHAETEEMRQCMFNKIHGTNNGLKTEEEFINADIRMSTETGDCSATRDIREKSSRTLELEKLKEQVASWRVILHRLPIDTAPPSTTTSGGAYKMNIATSYSEPEIDEKMHKIVLRESTNELDGIIATYSYHVDHLMATSEAKAKKYNIATKTVKPMTIVTNFELNAADNFICEHCRKSFETKLKLRQHISIHNLRLHSKSMATRLNRFKIHNTDDKPYKCEMCEFKSARSSHLQIHLRTHSGEKPYKCKMCDHKSARSSHLQIHLRTHSGEKPYKCKMCDYKSARSGDLKIHMRRHTGEKPYKCKACDFESTNSKDLKRHMRIHTGEKPYECKTCNFKCNQSSNLKKHMCSHAI